MVGEVAAWGGQGSRMSIKCVSSDFVCDVFAHMSTALLPMNLLPLCLEYWFQCLHALKVGHRKDRCWLGA